MTIQRFTDWLMAQPEWVVQAAVVGPPFLVFMVIGLSLGGKWRTLLFQARFGPTLGRGWDAWLGERLDRSDAPDWTDRAEGSVDAEIARRRRHLR